MDKTELQSYLDVRGVPYDKRWSVERLQGTIAEYEMNNNKQPATAPEIKPVSQPLFNTPAEVETAIDRFLKVDGFEARITEQEWHFRCKGAEEAGNMSVPLRVIVNKAESVSRGRRGIKSMGRDGTYPNSYADSILSA
jgi:hypothetical protein